MNTSGFADGGSPGSRPFIVVSVRKALWRRDDGFSTSRCAC